MMEMGIIYFLKNKRMQISRVEINCFGFAQLFRHPLCASISFPLLLTDWHLVNVFNNYVQRKKNFS